MAKVLVLELDSVFAAVIEDVMLVSGHEAELVSDPAVAVSTATEGRADLLIMELELPGVSGIEIVRQLRQQSETRSLPIVALSTSDASEQRIAALKAGVDDFMTKPCDPEELLIRVDRLLGGRDGAVPSVLRGDLKSHPIWELLQYVQQATKSGDLTIHDKKGSGRLRLDRGRVTEARWERLRGRDALLAIVDMKDGSFQLTTVDGDGGAPLPEAALHIPDVLIQAAWLTDELAKRREHMAATGAPLEVTGQDLPPLDDAFNAVPLAKIHQQIQQQPGVRLYELTTQGDDAPSKVRLAVAWLIEHGVVALASQPRAQPMSTTEITSSVVIDVAVHNLLSGAKAAGFDVSALPYFLLAEPSAWKDLQQLPASVPGFLRIDALRNLVERTQQGQGGSATFESEVGKLSLHVQPLADAGHMVDAIVPVCAGVLLWIHEVQAEELIRKVISRLEASTGSAVGILVATSDEAHTAAEAWVANTHKWKVSSHAPRSLLGAMRLMHPRSS